MHVPQTEVILQHDGAELARVKLPPGEYIIGRGDEADIHAATPLISRQHARLTINYDHVLIEDLGSSNGTFVAERQISESVRLFPNQAVRLGDVQVEIHWQRPRTEAGSSLAPAQAAIERLLPEELLAQRRYAVGQQVARGGMGAILQAEQAAMKRRVAMKVMLESPEEADVLRFIEEAQITGQLEHPNIVPIYELGVDEQGQLFYTMKFVRGITLKKVFELLAQNVAETVRKFSLPALLTVFQKTCDAIALAHSKNVIHRDLKPENIMLGDFGEVLVMDWGLAKVIGTEDRTRTPSVFSTRGQTGGSSHTLAGTILGTPQYMAPEQARGEVDTMDGRADIYALGAILFEILYLRPPISGADAWAIVEKVKRGGIEWSPPAGAPARKRTPPADSLVAICRKALALDREQRYARVDELQDDITAYQHGFATSAEKASWPRRALLAIKRNRTASIATALVLFAMLFFGSHAVLQGRKAARALADLKRNAPSLLQLADAEATYQRFDSALEKIDGALSIDPALRPAWWRRATVLIGLERWAEAATALRVAQRHGPANAGPASLAANLEKLAAMPGDEARFGSHLMPPIMDYLERTGAAGERLHFAKRLLVSAEKRQKLVQERIDQWRGTDRGKLRVNVTGPMKWVTVKLMGSTVDTLEPLRGLPIDVLTFNSRSLTSLEPLRGMPLHELECGGTPISDLEPLRGMPLRRLVIANTKVANLSPLRGLPLEYLDLSNTPASDARPLAGLPLKHLGWHSCQATDLSPLKGTPLETLFLYASQVADLSFLAGAPLKRLEIHANRTLSDLRPLAGLPLKDLNIENCTALSDLRPLLDLRALERLKLSGKRNNVAVLRQHPTLQFIGVNTAPHRPVAEYWAESESVLPSATGVERRTLRGLDLIESPITSIEFIRGQPLELIDIRRTKVSDLSPIAGMKDLKVLRVAGCPIKDFSPLKGLALTELRIGKTEFTDLSLLEGMPLALLTIDNSRVTDLAPLARMTSLRMLCIPKGAKNIEALRQLPQLAFLSYNFSIDREAPDKTAEVFWLEYDADRKAAGK